MNVPDVASPVVPQNVFGDGAALHHVGMAVRSIRTHFPDAAPVPNETEGVSLAFVSLHGVTVELLEPLSEGSPIQGSLDRGAKILHLCYEVPDLDRALEAGHAAGFMCIGEPRLAEPLGNRRTAWVFSKVFGLFELLERATAKGDQMGGVKAEP